jgi:hypothetical protein
MRDSVFARKNFGLELGIGIYAKVLRCQLLRRLGIGVASQRHTAKKQIGVLVAQFKYLQ